MIRGIDLSHYQSPGAVPWAALGAAGAFAIVRMTYGAARDERASDHVARARAAGVRVGAYHFFRASEPVEDQLAGFFAACNAAGYGKPADIVPAVDWEDDTAARPILPAHAPLVEELCGDIAQHLGHAPLLYITARDWGRVGSPEWAFDYPLWVAHYSSPARTAPATPGNRPWTIWQHRVGPLELDGPHGYYQPAAYDQNLAQFLPLLDGSRFGALPGPAPSGPPELLDPTEGLRLARLDELARQGVAEVHAEGMAEMAEEDT